MTNEERKAPTPGPLSLDAKKKRIQLLHPAVWARQTTRRLTAEFERIQKFLASPASQQIEQDLVDTKRLIARLNEYPPSE
jgi:hypothetical protein